jgi:hypothetical protein
MNIFVLSLDPREAAEYHCDKHVVKMILETAQLLYCSHWMLESRWICLPLPIRKLTLIIPCSIWIRESIENYQMALRAWNGSL